MGIGGHSANCNLLRACQAAKSLTHSQLDPALHIRCAWLEVQVSKACSAEPACTTSQVGLPELIFSGLQL